ncbi:hypothetical protein [Formosa sp. L2A11]|uniref:hypothetical protein n=1 Tax=Formosa sp. L2A11 TaxID=2686363 RepID=UPI00131D5A9A|nr:hypothetical protein [Formosa sp. L2A11]
MFYFQWSWWFILEVISLKYNNTWQWYKVLYRMGYRMFLNSNDVAILMGVCNKTAKRYIQDIRQEYNIVNRKQVTIREYSEYFKVPYDDVLRALLSRVVNGKLVKW